MSRTPSATVCGSQFVEDFLAHRVVDFGQRGEIEIDAEQFDQARALVGVERFQQRAEVGFVQVADQNAQRRHVDGLDGARSLGDKIGADGAIFVAQRRLFDQEFGHAGSRQRRGDQEALVRSPLPSRQILIAKNETFNRDFSAPLSRSLETFP